MYLFYVLAAKSLTVAMATVYNTSKMTVGDGEKSTIVQIDVPAQHHPTITKPEGNGEESGGTVNSSRWTDGETMALLGLWRANYRLIKGKKRNYQEWTGT